MIFDVVPPNATSGVWEKGRTSKTGDEKIEAENQKAKPRNQTADNHKPNTENWKPKPGGETQKRKTGDRYERRPRPTHHSFKILFLRKLFQVIVRPATLVVLQRVRVSPFDRGVPPDANLLAKGFAAIARAIDVCNERRLGTVALTGASNK